MGMQTKQRRSVRALTSTSSTALIVVQRQAAFSRTHGTPVQGTQSNGEKLASKAGNSRAVGRNR